MAANTVLVSDILVYLATELKEWRSEYISAVTNAHDLVCAALTSTTTDNYKFAVARVRGKGDSVVQSYNGTSKELTFSPDFTSLPVAGEYLQMAWWKGDKRAQAFAAIETAVRLSYPGWYREVILDKNHTLDSKGNTFTNLVLSSTSDTYSLPSDVAGHEALVAIGLHQNDDSTYPVDWIPPLNLWRVIGQPGALQLKFNGRMTNFLATYDTYTLCLHYEAREPVPAADTDTVQMPLEYFRLAAEIYRQRQLNQVTQNDIAKFNVNLPQLQINAQEVLAEIGALMTPLKRGPSYGMNFS